MAESRETPTINMERFLTLAVQMLDSYFFKEHKEKARKLFKEIDAGQVVRVGTLNLEQDRKASVALKLALDHSEYRGHLTFHRFRQGLDAMLKNIAGHIRRKQDLNVFNSEETGEVLFNIPGLVEEHGTVNILVLGLQAQPGTIVVKLQFLDPAQFQKEAESGAVAGNDDAGS